MITVIDNNLDLAPGCALVSCRFDKQYFEHHSAQEIASVWNITFPLKMEKAVDKRKAEFIAGRYCASQAIQLLNIGVDSSQDIHIGEKREPLWPSGVSGSITHSKGFAAAVAADTRKIRGIGIDSEQLINPKTAKSVSTHILTTQENFEDNVDVVADSTLYLTLLFSAKESIFKCLYPFVQQYFDFKDAVITLDAERPNTFTFVLQKTLTEEFGEGYQGAGSFSIQEDFVHTAITLGT